MHLDISALCGTAAVRGSCRECSVSAGVWIAVVKRSKILDNKLLLTCFDVFTVKSRKAFGICFDSRDSFIS